jgi:hypothetical protein
MTTAELQQARSEFQRRNIRMTWDARHIVLADDSGAVLIARDPDRLATILQGVQANRPLTAFLHPGYSGSMYNRTGIDL